MDTIKQHISKQSIRNCNQIKSASQSSLGYKVQLDLSKDPAFTGNESIVDTDSSNVTEQEQNQS